MFLKRYVATIILSVCVGWTSHVSAEITMKFSLAAPEKTPWAANAHDISKYVSGATNGRIKINVFSGSQLGNEQDVIRQVARGRIQLGSFSNTAASLMVPEIALLAAPYLWRDRAQADCALDNYLIPVFQEKFIQKGLVILGWSEVGYMGYASKEPIRNLSELAGLKIRVAPTKASSIIADTFGANSVMLPITEVATALQTGLVEAADLPGLAFTSLGFSKIVRNWVASNHSHQVGVVLMSVKVWKTLSKSDQEALMRAQANPKKLRMQVRGAEKALLQKFVKSGGNLVSLSDTEMKKWKAVAQKARTKLVDAIGGDAEQVFRKIQNAKKACGN